MKLAKSAVAIAASVCLSVGGVAVSTPSAHADANGALNAVGAPLAGALMTAVGGAFILAPATPVCGGPASIFPVVVANWTTQSQTGSITIDPDLAHQVQIYSSYQDALAGPFGEYVRSNGTECPGRPEWDPASGVQGNFTVSPGQQLVFWMAAGGMDHNLIESSHNIAIGGLPGGTSGQSWYDFALTLGADEQFKSIQLQYRWTGGINSDNNQNGFNVVQCGQNGNQAWPTSDIVSPYQGWGTYNYGFNEAMCLGWFPEGNMMATSSGAIRTGAIVESVDALQYDPTGKQLNAVLTLNPNSGVTEMSSPAGPMANSLQGSWVTTSCDPGTALCTGYQSGANLANGAWFYAQTDGGASGEWSNSSKVILEGIPLKCNRVSIQLYDGDGGATDVLDVSNIPNMPAC